MAAANFDRDVVVPRHGGGAAGTTGPLGLHAASRKIGKPGGAAGHGQQERKPVIIYMVSPKVIHVEAHEFLPLVQRLTGPEAAGCGDKKSSRPSTSGCAAAGSSSPRQQEADGARSKIRTAAPPVRVKAPALNRPAGAAVSVSVTATTQQAAAPSPSGLLFHDLSPLRGAALKGEHHPLVSPGWLHHVGDHFLSPGGAATFGSPSPAGFLDIFGSLSSQQQ